MKNIIYKLSGALLVVLLLGVMGCEKEELPKLSAEMETWKQDGITSTSAELSGFVVAEGDGYTEHGVVWGAALNPTVEDSKKVAEKVEKAVYWVTVEGLEFFTTYHYRAYVIDKSGSVTYGKDATFTTLANVPLLSLDEAKDITAIFAKITGNVTNDGKDTVTTRGICYNILAGPTVTNDTTINGNGTGEFVADLDNLLPATKYYARAYAINKMGVGYSNEVSFTTANGVAALATDSVGEIRQTTAKVYGKVIVNGGSAITERGFVMASTDNPTTADTKIVDAENLVGVMSGDLTGLDTGKKYFVRAFATNEEGTSYGNTLQFTTDSEITKWFVPGGYVAASYPGSDWLDWDPENSPFVMNTDAEKSKLEGYVYMAGANNDWKFASKPSWVGPNYGNSGTPGVLSNDDTAPNFALPKGYYKINVDMSTTPMTYTAVATQWGVIGDASPGGWDNSTDLSYDPASQTWRGSVHLNEGSFKFRANNAWDIEYGSSAADNTLNAGGDNIANGTAADYDITLDLSKPNTYTYTANRWGLIGDATPGKWDSDTDMTWDAVNNVFTATLDLTVGEMKYRANDDWDVNYGGSLGALTDGGDNIAVTEAGNYTVTLNTMTKVGTITKN